MDYAMSDVDKARGHGVSRRECLAALAAAMIGSRVSTIAQAPPQLKARNLNHLSIRVSNLARSVDFYQKVFGIGLKGVRSLVPPGSNTFGLDLPSGQFLSLSLAKERFGVIDHYGFGVEGLRTEKDTERLRTAGYTITGLHKDGWFFIRDPDGCNVQVMDVRNLSVCPKCAPPPGVAPGPVSAASLLKTTNINHLSINVENIPRSVAFYQRVFGIGPDGVRTLVPPGSNTFGLDIEAHQLLSLTLAKQNFGVVSHFGFGVENLSTKRDPARIRAAGYEVSNIADGWFFIRDPDGNNVQVMDVRDMALCPQCDLPPTN